MVYRPIVSATLLLTGGVLMAQQNKPNVVFILADDLGYGDITPYGQKLIETPHLQKMAEEGMRFTDFYAGCSVSAPSRASLMTGLHTGHTQIRGNKEIKPEGQAPMGDKPTLANLFKQAGYQTGIFGKWGLGYPSSGTEPLDKGFDTFTGYNCQRESHLYYPLHLWRDRDKVLFPENGHGARRTYSGHFIHKDALRFIEQSAEKKEPFFAMLTYTLPHAELNLPHDSLYKHYRQKLEPKPWTSKWEGDYPNTEDAHASFAAMVAQLDEYVGEVEAKLKQLGIADNTIVIFASDNGPHREGGADPEYFDSNGPLRGIKRDLYEGGIRVPLIVKWPKAIKAGSTNNSPGAFWDFYPTFAALTNQKASTNDGINLLPAWLHGKTIAPERSLYWEFHESGGSMAIRQGKWKLVALGLDTNSPKYELYDLSNDIGETHDLTNQYPQILKKLRGEMERMHLPSQLFPFKNELTKTN